MYHSFFPNLVRPNLPLRKPSSSPVALCAKPPTLTTSDVTPVRMASGGTGDGPMITPLSKDTHPGLGSVQPALTLHFCNYCGQQGNFRCKRCKKTPYCSVECQTEDWKAHRHMCKSFDPEPAKQKPEEITALPVTGDRADLLETGDASSLQRVYLHNLPMTKVVKGADIQASVVEFYSPSRFFLLAQSPEVLGALQNISTELLKTYIHPPATTHVPCVGEVCAVQFSCDMNWYRGLIQSMAADQKSVNVLYIDFGNEEVVSVERIKPLAANIPPFCPCAMECRIARVMPVFGRWSGECCIAVTQLLGRQTVTVKMVETQEHGRVHAVDIRLSTGKQLSTFLVEHGYAEEENVNVTPTEQEINAMVNASSDNFRCQSDGKDVPLTQAVGDSFPVVVTHLQSPSEIIVQKAENAGVIRELQLQLREHCSQVPAAQNFRPAPGTVCCAQFSEDKQWYRAKILAYSSEKRVCVGYVDFGNSEEVDLGHLRPITTSLLSLPTQTIPCVLAGVQPVGEKWSEDCLLALQQRILNRVLCVKIQGAQEGKALVAMIDEANDPQANIAELLTSAGFAAPAPVTASSDQQADQTANTATVEPQVPTPSPEPLVWTCTELPCDGQAVALLASVVMNPEEFYCRINNPTEHQRLIELGTDLKQHCEAKGQTSPFAPKVGEPCCVMFTDDGVWYRAMVNGLSEDEVSVQFVDYGYSMKVEKKHLRSITPRLLTLPFQAVRCRLAGVEPLGSEWSSEALLWFQGLVDGEELSAYVLSVSEQGFDVKLESRGQDVAAALISEHFAKAPGAIPKETHATTGSEAKHQEKIKDSEQSQVHAQASNQTGVSPKETPTEGTSILSEAPFFPGDWKTLELPLNETFEPYIAAVISPSLFYVLCPSQVDQQKLQGVMTELATYCSNIQASLSSNILSRPAPGAACCAQFSADKNWYRAVVLDSGENEMSVIYADFGNTEKVPLSRILPIPAHLLQLPFQIIRCTLTGKEHFPAELPGEVQQMFQSLLLNGVLATVQSFDGSANVLSLTLPTECGGGHISPMILDTLQALAKSSPHPSHIQGSEQTNSNTCTTSTTTVPDCPQPKLVPETQMGLQNTPATSDQTMTPELAHWTLQQKKTTSVNEDLVQTTVEHMEPPCEIETKPHDSQTSDCCCLSLKTKIDHLEQLMKLQLSIIEKLVGQMQ